MCKKVPASFSDMRRISEKEAGTFWREFVLYGVLWMRSDKNFLLHFGPARPRLAHGQT
tara:strand:+ start:331 stop:504 length:174 start_codon:yes stop_codon:yes gene_type:complete